MTTRSIPRRTVLAAGTLAVAGCANDDRYFGAISRPTRQRLVYANGSEPDVFDPGTYAGGAEMRIISALFDGLTKFHPHTLEPMAALATHYEANGDSTRFTFYLRGHPSPRGTRFINTDDLPVELSRGCKAPPDNVSAVWSDGVPITAHDFVYSWRRVVDPHTGSADGNCFYCIENAEEIHRGRREPECLGVRATDDLTLQVDLRTPTAHFLALQTQRAFFPVPRHGIERGAKWGEVSSGAFMLKEQREHEKVVLMRNPRYYERAAVGLDELVFLPVNHELLINLYKAGEVDATDGAYMRASYIPGLRRKRDFHFTPVLERLDYPISVRKPPLDNVLLRYALNMAIDKHAVVAALEAGQFPAPGYIPQMAGCHPVTTLSVAVDGISFDVLRYDPRAARALLAKAGFPGGVTRDRTQLSIGLTHEATVRLVPEILQQQWRTNLGIDVNLHALEFVAWIRTLLDVSYQGVAKGGWTGKYPDPATFIDIFQSGSVQSGTGWSDPKFDALLASADAARSKPERMRRLADCERFLLAAMPMIPIDFEVYSSLVKPYVRGWATNPLNEHYFKYVWIDQGWRPS